MAAYLLGLFTMMFRSVALLFATAILGTIAANAATPRFPITFEENREPGAQNITFLARAARYRLVLRRDGALIIPLGGNVVRIRLANANRATPGGVDRLVAKSNYLIDSDPATWRIGIPNYREVRYAHVYSKIDLLWHGHQREIEHDFVLDAGADPQRIQLDISGETLHLKPNGDLTAGSILFKRPRAYQGSREIACRYILRDRRVGFAVGAYDHTRSLTIDPVLSFSTFLGGSGMDSASAVALDRVGNIYVAGITTSMNFPISAGAVQPTPAQGICGAIELTPCPNIFVTKFTNDGSTLLFSTYLGGSGQNSVSGMAVDQSGNVYLTGLPGGSDFPNLTPLPGTPAQPLGRYVAKLSSDGSSVLYATMLPYAIWTEANTALAVDASGSVYLTGSTFGGLPVVNAFQSTAIKPPLFKTTDSAMHWQGLSNGLPNFVGPITVDPINPQTLYLGAQNGLYKSTDGGGSWSSLLQGTPPQAPYPGEELEPSSIAVDPSNPQTVYLGTGLNGIYKSTDGGATWSPAGSGASRFVTTIVIDPASTMTLYAATGAGVYVSTDRAMTWNPTGLMAPPSNTNPGFVVALVIDPSTPTTLYAGTAQGVMKTVDGGVTWTTMANGFTQSTDIISLAIDPINPQVLYASTTINFAPYRTTDGGAHWMQSPLPSSGGLTPYINGFLVDPLVHTTVWVVTDQDLLVSHDSGLTWASPPTDLPGYGISQLAAGSDGSIYAVAHDVPTAAFAMKLDPSGSQIVYSTYLAGSGWDSGEGIAVDSSGRAYVTGLTSSFDFPVANALQARPGGLQDAFVSVLDPSGSQILWSTYLGGEGDDWSSAIAVDSAGNVHLAGWTFSSNFPLAQASQSLFAGNGPAFLPNAFVTKIKSDGSGLIFSTYLGGSGGDEGYAIAADSAGNTYVAGDTGSQDFPTLNAPQSVLAGTVNAFVAAWNGQTGALEYSTYLGGSGRDGAGGITADANGNAYIAGDTSSPDFPVKYPYQYVYAGNEDAFLAKIAPAVGPSIALAGVTNAASYGTIVSQGEIFSIFGTALAVTPASANAPPLPVKLSDVSVAVNGVVAPLFYVSPLQINGQIPFETAVGTAQIEVTSSAGTATLNMTVAPAASAIFTLNSEGTGAGAIEHGITGELVTDANPAMAGEIVSIYCTGLGAVSPPVMTGAAAPVPPPQTVLPVQVYIAGVPAQVTYSGLAPGFAGLYQVNAQVPAATPPGNQNLQIVTGGATSNTVTLFVQ